MTTDIKIGILVEDLEQGGFTVDWPDVIKTSDGSNPTSNRWAGLPFRQISMSGIRQWLKRDKALRQIYHAVKTKYPDSNDPEYAPIDDKMISIAERLRRNGLVSSINKDRANWLYFWLKRARRVFGSNAMIQIG